MSVIFFKLAFRPDQPGPFAAGTQVQVKWAPEYGTATVVRGTICEVTGQMAVQFADSRAEYWYYPESLVEVDP